MLSKEDMRRISELEQSIQDGLTPKQIALQDVWIQKWIKIALREGPTDLEAGEAAIRLAYDCNNKTFEGEYLSKDHEDWVDPPERVIWFDSPLAGCLGATLLIHEKERVVWAQLS